MRNLAVKFMQISPEAVFILPSADGEPYIRGYLRSYKVPFEDTVIRFAGKDVKAIKISTTSNLRYVQMEMRSRQGNMSFHLCDEMGQVITFKMDHYVYLDEPLLPTGAMAQPL